MANHNGWIKMHRRFTSWEWIGCASMVQLFVWLLLSASDKDERRRGVTVRRGQVLISQRRLAQQLHMSYQTLRTCLQRLQSTGEVTTAGTKGTQGYTIVTICNYDSYQAPANDKQRIANALSTHLPTHLPTHCSNGANISNTNGYGNGDEATNALKGAKQGPKPTHIYKKNKEDNGGGGARTRTREEAYEALRNELRTSTLKAEAAMRATRTFDSAVLMGLVEEVFADWTVTDEADICWRHLLNQLRIKAEAQRREAAKMAAIPKPKQPLKDWRRDFAAGMLAKARQRLAEDELSDTQKN